MAEKRINLLLRIGVESTFGIVSSINSILEKMPDLQLVENVNLSFYNNPYKRTSHRFFRSPRDVNKLKENLLKFGREYPRARTNGGDIAFYYTRPINKGEVDLREKAEKKKMKSLLKAKIDELKSLGIKLPKGNKDA